MLTWNTRPEPTTIVCLSATGIHRDPMPMCSIWTVHDRAVARTCKVRDCLEIGVTSSERAPRTPGWRRSPASRLADLVREVVEDDNGH